MSTFYIVGSGLVIACSVAAVVYSVLAIRTTIQTEALHRRTRDRLRP